METVDVIIPTKNRSKLLSSLVAALVETNYFSKIYIVNTGKNKIVFRDKRVFVYSNQNFLKSKNFVANLSKSEWLLFLDDDVLVSKTILKTFFNKVFSKKFDAYSVFVKSGTRYKLDLIRLVYYCHLSFYKVASLNEKKVLKKPFEPDFLPGCFMLISKSTFKKIGGFDENYKFPFYNEDTDLTVRIKKTGGKMLVFPDITVKHLKAGGGVRSKFNKKEWFSNFGFNNSYFINKNFGIVSYILYLVFRVRDHLFVLKQFDINIYKSYLKGAINGYKNARS